MSSLAELPELVGFFSYSRKDDELSQGSLTKLRASIYNEMRLQLGRDFKLWQDTTAIAHGELWEDAITSAISESAFFIPIVTPSAIGSTHCRFEFESFLKRESALGRKDLVFPILYVKVPALDREQVWRADELLRIIGARQYADWQKFRHRDVTSQEVAEKVEQFCSNILDALQRPSRPPAEGRDRQEHEADRIEEDNRRRQEAETKQLAEEERLKQAMAEQERQHRDAEEAERQNQAKALTDQERLRREAEAEERKKRAEAQAQAQEEERRRQAEAKQRAEEEEQERRKKADALAQARAQDERRRQDAEAKRRAYDAARHQPAAAKPMPVLRPGESFKESASSPEMVVVPAGEFMMGSPASEAERSNAEAPRHKVTFARPFAISRFAVTFDDWDTCVANGGGAYRPADQDWGRGQRPVINVSWNDAKAYAAWLAKIAGKPYRLVSEAEYEYAARAATQTAFPWSDEIGKGNANCNGCGSEWDNKRTAPVGSFPANPFGLHEMAGNVWEWVEDCWHDSYSGAPENGAAWIDETDHGYRVVRGGSWSSVPRMLRTAGRNRFAADRRDINLGFRVARTL